MPKLILALLVFCCAFTARGQVAIDVDTSNPRIKAAVSFLIQYLSEFKDRKYPDYSSYWSSADLSRQKGADDMVHAITTDGATYNFCHIPTIFYARPLKDHVHMKTMFSTVNDSGRVTLWAITNHYAYADAAGGLYFKSELERNKKAYTTIQNGPITYHFPVSHKFDRSRSNRLIQRIRKMEKEWGFQPLNFDYYFADNNDDLIRMKGMDYCLGMDDVFPSGMGIYETRTVICQGMGEDYYHEVLHLYFNPLYGRSPLNHGMVYYFAGGIGHDFDWMMRQLNDYLTVYPDADLSAFEDLHIKRIHIDHVITGLVCKIIYEKEGVDGLRRALVYKTFDEVLKNEFSLGRKDLSFFLKEQLAKYLK